MPIGPWENVEGGCAWCRGKRLGFDSAVALGPYQGPIRHVCLAMKRSSGSWLGRWAADLLIEARGDVLRAVGASAVVPIPLHWSRHLTRRHNQADVLADRLAERLGLPSLRPLRRAYRTPKLAGMSRTERAARMKDAFRAREEVRGRTVLLVDDILTSGATCGSAARALKKAGAKRVVAVVLGRA